MKHQNFGIEDIFFRRDKTMDEYFRQHFYFKRKHPIEIVGIKKKFKKKFRKINIEIELEDPQLKKLFDSKNKIYECEYITVSGGFHGYLKILKKQILFLTNAVDCKKKPEYGAPVIFFLLRY